MGQMHQQGFGSAPNCALAVKFLKSVAERGVPSLALSPAHHAYRKGQVERAIVMYARAAEQGLEVAQSNSAWLLNQNIENYDDTLRQLAMRHFEHAAAQGSTEAERILGDYHYYGTTNKSVPNFALAVKHYQVASDSGDAQATFNLGFMHEHGLGLPKDLHLAKRYYDQSRTLSADGMFATELALASLKVHFYLEKFAPDLVHTFSSFFTGGHASEPAVSSASSHGDELTASSSSSSSSSPPSSPSPSPSTSSGKSDKGSGEEQPPLDGLVDAISSLFSSVAEKGTVLVEHVSSLLGDSGEDVVLAVLVGALALVIYINQNR